MGTVVMTNELPKEWQNLPHVLDTGEVADLLKVDQVTVTRMLNRGDLPGFKAGRHWRVHKHDLLKYVGLIDDN